MTDHIEEEPEMPDLTADINCPNCNQPLQIKVREMVPGHSMRCPSCDCEIQFGGEDGRKFQQALDEFERKLDRLGRKFR